MLTTVVLTQNSASTLVACLNSIKFSDKILVIDDGSTDDTPKIATKNGATVLHHLSHDDFSAQRNYALSRVPSGWVLFIDSDEIVPPSLASEILQSISSSSQNGFLIKRVDHLWGRVLRYGDTGNTYLLRLAKVGTGVWQGKVHETWNISGDIGTLHQAIDHFPHPTLYQFLKSLNYYSTLRAKELSGLDYHSHILQITFFPIGKFIYLYILKLGFLDGTAGFIHSMLMSFYTFLVRGKLFLLSKHIGE